MRIWEPMALAVRSPSPAKGLEAVPQSKAERHGLCGMMVCSDSRFSPFQIGDNAAHRWRRVPDEIEGWRRSSDTSHFAKKS
jgi:hypothetical protein